MLPSWILEISQEAQIFVNSTVISFFWNFHSMLRVLELSQEAHFFGSFTVITDFCKFYIKKYKITCANVTFREFYRMLRFLELSQSEKDA